ncbi:hypothetical protein AB0J07_21890, partial [Microbispora rosea]
RVPTAVVQTVQRVVQARLIRPALAGPVMRIPALTRVPVVRSLVARFIGLGVLPEHVRLTGQEKRSQQVDREGAAQDAVQ